MVAKRIEKKKSVKKQSLDINKIITYFITIIICAGLFFNGYFFENQSLTVSILTTAFFVIALILFYKKQISLYYDKKTALLGLVFLLINIIGLFTASNTRDALGNVLVISNAILIYFLASQSLRDKENLNLFFKGFYWTTVFIASLGIISYITGVNLLNSYSGNRLFSTLGYPNTAALVFIFATFIGYYLKNNTLTSPNLLLYSNSILILAFIGTKSRGVFLITPLLLIIYILLQAKENRLKVTADFLLLILPSIVIAPVIFNGTFTNRELNSILISLVGVLILFAFYYFSPYFMAKKNIKIISILALLLIMGVGGYFVIKQDLSNTNIFSRFTDISLEDSSVMGRLIFMQDAFKIVKDNLLLGTGGGGWNAEYRAYRSYLYFTSEVHNHYLQVLVENGILGFIVYLCLWYLLIFNLWRKYTVEKSDSNLLLMTVALGLMLHSMIDFDLTYPVMYFLFWILIAIAPDKLNSFQGLNKQGKLIFLAAPLVLLLFINTSLLIGWSYGRDGTRLMARNNLQSAIEKLETSTVFDPVNPTYLTNLSQLYLAKGINDDNQEYRDKAIETINKSVKHNPTNFEWHIIKTRFLVELGKYEEAYQTALQAIRCAPFEEVVYFDTAKFFVDAPNNKGLPYAESLLNLAQKEGERIKENPYEKMWLGTNLNSSRKIAFLEGQMLFNNKQYELAKMKFAFSIVDSVLNKETEKYLQKAYELSDNYIINGRLETGELNGWIFHGNGGMERSLVQKDGQNWMRISKGDIETQWWGFYQLVYDFSPGQKYDLSFDALSQNDTGEIQLIVHQVGEDGGDPQRSTILKIDSKAKKYNWTFQTDNLNNKDRLRVYFLATNSATAQDLYITNIKMTKVN